MKRLANRVGTRRHIRVSFGHGWCRNPMVGDFGRNFNDPQKNTFERAYRRTHTRAVVETFWRWCRAQCHRAELLPKNPLAKALRSARQRRSGWEVFLDAAEGAIDTNHLERAPRPMPLGKRNGLFTSSAVGAQRVGIIRSLRVACRLHEVDACTYLVEVLQRISVHPANRAIEPTPRMGKLLFADAPLRSDLGAHHHDPPSH